MNSNLKTRKAKAGLLLIASPRFKMLGEGLKRGTYAERKSCRRGADARGRWISWTWCSRGSSTRRRRLMAAMDRFYHGEGGLRDCGVSLLVGGFRLDPLPARHARGAGPLRECRPGTMSRSGTRSTRTTSSTTSAPGRSWVRSRRRGRCPARGAGIVRVVMGSREEVTARDPALCLGGPGPGHPAAVERGTAGQLQRGDVVDLHRPLRSLHQTGSRDPFPALFGLRRGDRRRERGGAQGLLRRS